MSKKGLPSKEIRKVIARIEPDLQHLLDLLAHSDHEDDEDAHIVEDMIEKGARDLLIAKRIIKERKKH